MMMTTITHFGMPPPFGFSSTGDFGLDSDVLVAI
jgi:hypothetical protein